MTKTALLTGDTFRFRDRIRTAEFRGGGKWLWNAERKVWTLAIPDRAMQMSADQIEDWYVRSIPGISNRGNFSIQIEGVA